jgi:4-aminobutyrate aminotransferase
VDFENGETADAVELAALGKGLLVLRAGDTAIRIAPPLVLREDQARAGLQIFEKACAEVSGRTGTAPGTA